MSIFGFRKTKMVAPEEALPGRDTPLEVPVRHAVLGAALKPPYPEGSEVAEFALGCFWGEERTFWQVPGVITTEDYHQQYLYRVPNGYCPDHSTGVSCPVGLNLD